MNPSDRPAEELAAVVGRFSGRRLWVAGDIMLDEYVIGEVGRISPEAPVPVVRVRERLSRLGGAGNVARQIVTLGAEVALCGVIGHDNSGDAVLERCRENSIDSRAIRRLEGHHTTHKIRVLGARQQLLRLDWEETGPCPQSVTAPLVAKLGAGDRPDAIVLSDYSKGFLTQAAIADLLEAGRVHQVPVLIDPKSQNFATYCGADILTPNLRELEAASGRSLHSATDEAISEAARAVMEENGIGALVVTLGERGVLVVPKEDPHTAIPAHRRAVFDVTGAGDTVIAVLALATASGASLEVAARIANTAAGIAVGQVGAAAVPAAEIVAAFSGRATEKILSRRGLVARVEEGRLQGKRVVFTNGCFDLLHSGHLSLLRQAADLGDVLVLAVNSDHSVRRLKGEGRPLVPEAERASLLAALDCVDAVTLFGEDTPEELIRELRPDVLAKGQDYRIDQVVGRDIVEAEGGRVELVPLLPERSTSGLIDRILNNADQTTTATDTEADGSEHGPDRS
jgi:D-beta-D-heptose 7-phosphate kinase/D-beta-D-heptose 1-phosphate adenosyltransferase